MFTSLNLDLYIYLIEIILKLQMHIQGTCGQVTLVDREQFNLLLYLSQN